ncbi:hypothetical protein CLIB1444_02S00584 [[Candida] jaroonii]|uniref:Uncharacterized protein n=1 Tax=[Candida] jaroonii TaxID=467808 RepID=A0ACA9Y3Y5_9ASCO|nr:hypothetical protein CLIB1444_02S00584 [[Candida] jaroonii]
MQKRSIEELDDTMDQTMGDDMMIDFDDLLADIEGKTTAPKVNDEKSDLISTLNKQKQDLFNTRTEKMNDIETIRLKIKKLKEQKERIIAERSLDHLIEENNEQFAKTPIPGFNSMETNESAALEKINVEPSKDWIDRLNYVKRFTSVNVVKAHIVSGGTIVYDFSLNSKYFDIPIIMTVNKDESIEKIEIKNTKAIGSLSPELNNLIVQSYMPECNISGIAYGLNSLFKILNSRIESFIDLVQAFKEYLIPSSIISSAFKILNQSRKQFIMRTVDSLEFIINQCKIIFSWEIIVQNRHLSTCGSKFSIILEKDDNIKDLTPIYLSTVNDLGTSEAFKVLIKRLFDITV